MNVPVPPRTKNDSARSARLFLQFCENPWRIIAVSVGFAIIQAALSVLWPALLHIFLRGIAPRQEIAPLCWMGLGLCLLAVFQQAFAHRVRCYLARQVKGWILRLRERAFRQVYVQSEQELQQRGEIHSLLIQDTERVDVLAHSFAAEVLPALLVSSGLMLCLVLIRWELVLVMAAVTFPIELFRRGRLLPRLRQQIAEFHTSIARYNRAGWRLLELWPLTRALAAEEYELRAQSGAIQELRTTGYHLTEVRSLAIAGQNTLFALATSALFVAGGILVAQQRLSLVALAIFTLTLSLLRGQLSTIFARIQQIQEGLQAWQRLDRWLTVGPEPVTSTPAVDDVPSIESLACHHVRFAFDQRPLLDDVNLTMQRGDSIAISGPNGCGKSTLVSLLLGLRTPQSGTVAVNGRSWSDLDARAYRQRIGVVPQEVRLFAGTLQENVTYGLDQVDTAALQRVARQVGLESILVELPDGWQTVVGEEGNRLSGGQRQRVAWARALLRRPDLLILDEPTNHLDAAALQRLLTLLRQDYGHTMVVLISHDPRAVSLVDRQFELTDGRLEMTRLRAA